MRFVLAAAAVALPLLSANAHADPPQHARHINYVRQAPPPPPPPPPPPAGTSASASASASHTATLSAVSSQSTPVSGSVSLPPGSLASGATSLTTAVAAPTFPSVSFTLHSTNPTAVPLSNIIANPPSAPTSPLASTPTAGSIPPSILNAPPLPDISGLRPTNYPALDKIPDVNSPEVQQWKQEVLDSGIPIPDITPTVAGGCSANPAAAADSSRCWWTCGGCTRNTDIQVCPNKMNWGLTYDDGPAYYTTQLLSYLDEKQLKSTFFVVGSRVISFPHILRAEYMSGHQIAVHTWSHPSLTTISNDQIIAELGWSRKAIKDVLGVTPNMMRPPYGDIDDRVRAISLAMGLIPSMWTRISPTATFDIGDFDIQSGLISAPQVLQNWNYIIGNATTINTGFILLEHDLYQDTVEIATGYILPDALSRGDLTIEPIAMCISRGLSNSYIETNDNDTFPPPQGSGALNASTTGGGNHDSGAIESFHISGAAVTLTILAGVLANMLAVL